MAEPGQSETLAERTQDYRQVVCEALGAAGWEINTGEELDEALRALLSSGLSHTLTIRANPEMPSDRLLADWYNLAWSAEWNRIDPDMKSVTLTGADAEKCKVAGYRSIWRAGCDAGMVAT